MDGLRLDSVLNTTINTISITLLRTSDFIMAKDYQRELEVAAQAVRAAATVCQRVQKSLVTEDTLAKKDKSPVTVADFASQAVVAATLVDAFGELLMVGEEDSKELREDDAAELRSKVVEQVQTVFANATEDDALSWIDLGGLDPQQSDTKLNRYWTLDPIDGTKGFLRGQQYAIALALIEDGEVVLGALGCPNLPLAGLDETEGEGTLMLAVKGQGVTMHRISDNDLSAGRKIAVSPVTDVKDAPLCESVESGHTDQGSSSSIQQQLGITAAPARLDSQAKYAVVARGDAAIYLRLPTRPGYQEKIWDHAAGVICVEEAGGKITDVDGKPLDFSIGRTLANNRGVICTNGPVHETVLEKVQDVLGAPA